MKYDYYKYHALGNDYIIIDPNNVNFKLNKDLIKRIKDTKPQYKLKKHERAENLAGAFQIDTKNLLPMKILIIDDICTTGSTFEEMIKEFEKHDIFDITCFAATTPFEE